MSNFNRPLKSEPQAIVDINRAMVERYLDGGVSVTLDGKPARIGGYRLPFPMVGNQEKSVEFCWATVERVLSNGGAFKS